MKEKLLATTEKAFECIKDILTDEEFFGIDPSKVKLESSLSVDLGLDNLDTYDLVYQIKERLGIGFPDERVWEFKTIEDVVAYVAGEIIKKEKEDERN